MYTRVVLRDADSGAESTVTLTYPADAEPAEGFVSVLSPLGWSLLGLPVGAEAQWSTPDGGRTSGRDPSHPVPARGERRLHHLARPLQGGLRRGCAERRLHRANQRRVQGAQLDDCPCACAKRHIERRADDRETTIRARPAAPSAAATVLRSLPPRVVTRSDSEQHALLHFQQQQSLHHRFRDVQRSTPTVQRGDGGGTSAHSLQRATTRGSHHSSAPRRRPAPPPLTPDQIVQALYPDRSPEASDTALDTALKSLNFVEAWRLLEQERSGRSDRSCGSRRWLVSATRSRRHPSRHAGPVRPVARPRHHVGGHAPGRVQVRQQGDDGFHHSLEPYHSPVRQLTMETRATGRKRPRRRTSAWLASSAACR